MHALLLRVCDIAAATCCTHARKGVCKDVCCNQYLTLLDPQSACTSNTNQHTSSCCLLITYSNGPCLFDLTLTHSSEAFLFV